jgi:hypothetical protein
MHPSSSWEPAHTHKQDRQANVVHVFVQALTSGVIPLSLLRHGPAARYLQQPRSNCLQAFGRPDCSSRHLEAQIRWQGCARGAGGKHMHCRVLCNTRSGAPRRAECSARKQCASVRSTDALHFTASLPWVAHLLADDCEVSDQQLVVMSNLHQPILAVAEVSTAVRPSLNTTPQQQHGNSSIRAGCGECVSRVVVMQAARPCRCVCR